jgi:ribonuclease T1
MVTPSVQRRGNFQRVAALLAVLLGIGWPSDAGIRLAYNRRMRRFLWILPALFLLGLWLWSNPRAPSPPAVQSEPAAAAIPDGASGETAAPAADAPLAPAFLPPEAREVLQRIARGGPFEYRQDGSVFQNRERRLPPQPRGYYREYTVETPGSRDRGARRIITGGEPPSEYWYTDDHYRSFRGFKLPRPEVQQ